MPTKEELEKELASAEWKITKLEKAAEEPTEPSFADLAAKLREQFDAEPDDRVKAHLSNAAVSLEAVVAEQTAAANRAAADVEREAAAAAEEA